MSLSLVGSESGIRDMLNGAAIRGKGDYLEGMKEKVICFFSSRSRHAMLLPVTWARRCV